jgi:PAS domain S-box-containing protein
MHSLDAAGTILWANQAELDMLGYRRDEYVGRSLGDFCADQAALESLKQLQRGENLVKFPAKLRAGSGSLKDVLINSSAKLRDGKLVSTYCVMLDVTAERQAEATLRESEGRLRALLQALPAALYTTDAAGRITYYNDAAAELWGHRPEIGKSERCSAWKLSWPDGSPLPHEQWPMALALRERRPIRGMELIAERPDGVRVPVAPFPTPLFAPSGNLIGAVNMLVDITDRKDIEQALRDRERELQTVIDQTPFLLVRCNKDLQYCFVSRSYAQMIGRSPEDVVGKNIVEIIGQEGLKAILPYIERVLKGERVEFEDEVSFAGIGRRSLHVAYVPDLNARGEVQGWLASIADASHREHADQIQQQLASIVDCSDDAIVSKDLNGTIVSWNKGAERTFGYTSDEAVGKSITILMPAELQEEEARILERIRRGERIDHFETVRRHKDGRLLDISLTVSPIKDGNGGVVGASKIARDITHRKQVRDRVAADLRAMTLLRDVGARCVREGADLDLCLHEILDAAIAITGADKGNVQLFDPGSGALTIAAQRGFEAPFLEFFKSISDDSSACGMAMRSGGRIIVEDVRRSEIFVADRSLEVLLDADVGAVTSTPLFSSTGALLGMISVHFAAPHRPSERELNLLDLMARQSADYLERRQFDSMIARRAQQQAVLYRFTDRLLHAETLPKVYDLALDAIIRALQSDRVAILRFDEAGIMRFVAWRGLSDSYRKAVEGHSPWSANDINAEPVRVEDVARADLPAPIKGAVMMEDIAALAFYPVAAHGELAGKLMTYYGAPRAFGQDEVELAQNIARQLGLAVERIETEQARRLTEEALRALNERLEREVERRTQERDRIWNLSEDLLAVSNFDGYFTNINPAWGSLLGWTEDEIKSMHVSELRHPDDAAHSMAGRARLAQGVPTVRMENRFRHKDGSWRWIQWTMTAEKGLIYVSGRHVTNEKEAAIALDRARLQRANSQKMEALGQLTGGVAHDFNNLLMIVSGHAQGLTRRLTDPRDARAVEAILIASARGESLTRQLLSFSRNQPLNETVVAPSDAINAVGDVLSGPLHGNIELSIDVPGDIWSIKVDKSELELALVNLVINARDAMPGGGRISITAKNVRLESADSPNSLNGDYVRLDVADTGAGIPDDILDKVFEPFFTTKGPDKGTGLGLSQVYGFAHRSNGTVMIDSQIGVGTMVTIYLPRVMDAADQPGSEDQMEYMAQGDETIMVVEDNREVCTVAVSLLEQLGYQTLTAGNTTEALDALKSRDDVALIFADVMLRGEADGLELARTVKARYPDIALVLTSGYSKVFGADLEFPVLRKPYRIAALGRMIREALKRRSALSPQPPENAGSSGAGSQSQAALTGRRLLVVDDEPLIAMALADTLERAGAEVIGPVGTEGEALKLIEHADFDGALLDAHLRGHSADGIAAALVTRNIPFIFVTGGARDGLQASFERVPILPKPFSDQQLLEALTEVGAGRVN